jgi:hypothetical protein
MNYELITEGRFTTLKSERGLTLDKVFALSAFIPLRRYKSEKFMNFSG